MDRPVADVRRLVCADDAQRADRDPSQDYIRTARGNGLSERAVVIKYGLRAAITPLVTMLGMDIALLVGGTVVVETIFNIQGIGLWVVQSVVNQDFPVVVAVVLVGALAVVLVNLIVDIAYAFPSIRGCALTEPAVSITGDTPSSQTSRLLEVRDLAIELDSPDGTVHAVFRDLVLDRSR